MTSRAPRAIRGGSWLNDAGRARSVFRSAYPPGDADVIDYLGFRVCLRRVK